MKDFRGYSGVAEIYERVRAPITGAVAADLVAAVEPGAGARILDVGSGTGVGAEAAVSAVPGGFVVGVDRSPEMLAAGARTRPGLRIAGAEAIQLPFRETTFDVVLANFVLTEFHRYDTALFDLIRVLRPSGRLAASTWVWEVDELTRTWMTLIEETIGEEMIGSARQEATPWAERFGNRDGLEQALRDAGLHPVRVERRSYRFAMRLEDYVEEQSTRALGRFVRAMLGEGDWTAFLERARVVYERTFPPAIEDTRDVLFAVGTKP